MTNAYEDGYRKLARVDELPDGEPRIYRTGGEAIVLLRDGLNVRAADATNCLPDNVEGQRERLRAVLECLGHDEWNAAVGSKPLPVRIDQGDVWVCVEAGK